MMNQTFHCFLSKSGKKRRRERQNEEQESDDSNPASFSPPVCKEHDDIPGPSHSSLPPEDLSSLPGPSQFSPTPEEPIYAPVAPDERTFLNTISDNETDDSSVCSEDTSYSDGSNDNDSDNAPLSPQPEDPLVLVEKFLSEWAFEANVSHRQLSLLCRGLKSNHPECFLKLHLDARTYFKTPRSKLALRDMQALNSATPGKYLHISVRKQLETLIPLLPNSIRVLKLLFTIDGLPLIKGGIHELWPILMRLILQNIICQVMAVGLYYGPGKPADNVEYLQEFIDELKILCADGLELNGIQYSILVPGFSCDSPAKAFILGICYPNAYYSCTRCTIEGEDWEITTVRGQTVKVSHKRVFIETACPARTDEEFRSRADTEYRPLGRETPLVELESLDMVNSIILDYQHLVLLGSMKYFMNLWFGTEPSQFKVSAISKQRVSRGILKFHSDIPCEFARQKPRELKVLSYWKATEFRLFLLYLGPILLKGVLDPIKYEHFIMLHLAITILVSPKYCSDLQQVAYAKSLLTCFVESTPEIYSETIMVHNLHNLIHLADDVLHFQQFFPKCTLDTISTFPPENYMQQMRKLSRAHSKKLEQVGLRIAEAFLSDYMQKKRITSLTEEVKFKDIHHDGPLLQNCSDPQYRSVIFPTFKLSSARTADSCCILDDGSNKAKIMCIENVAFSEQLNDSVVIGRIFKGLGDIYKIGDCSSSRYGIFTADELSSALEMRPISQIAGKYVCFNDNDSDGFFLFPLIHTID